MDPSFVPVTNERIYVLVVVLRWYSYASSDFFDVYDTSVPVSKASLCVTCVTYEVNSEPRRIFKLMMVAEGSHFISTDPN